MRFRLGTIAALGLLLALPPALACAVDAPATRRTQAENQGNSSGDETMPDLVVKSMSLGDFVTYLAHQWKDVQFIQVSGPWQDLTLPPLRLRNVTRTQVIMVLRDMFPELNIGTIDPNQPLLSEKGDLHGGNVLIFQQFKGAAIPVRTRVAAFGLAETVDRLALHQIAVSDPISEANKITAVHDNERKAMKDVLALIQATLDESAEPGVTSTVMLHEPTETVLIKGTPAQISAVTQALQALNSSMNDSSLRGSLLQAVNQRRVRQQLKVSKDRESTQQDAVKAGPATQHKPDSKE